MSKESTLERIECDVGNDNNNDNYVKVGYVGDKESFVFFSYFGLEYALTPATSGYTREYHYNDYSDFYKIRNRAMSLAPVFISADKMGLFKKLADLVEDAKSQTWYLVDPESSTIVKKLIGAD